ncbi:MAG TPA: hypothetical protein VJU61_04305 [Polyangiaceae bacterium]|nr:hypothetical protein [Polyangiaceae bacterium]
MSELVFPVVGALVVATLVLPLFALLAKAGLVLLERDAAGGPLHGFTLRYLLLTGSSTLPLAWLVSAALHQTESGETVLACLFDHAEGICLEPGVFAGMLCAGALACSARALFGSGRAHGSSSVRARALLEQLGALLERQPALAFLSGRVRVTEEPGFALATQGLLRPYVIIGADYAEALSVEALSSALAHEAEHVRALDPLRYLVLELAMALNPVGRALLAPHAYRWIAAREAHCDREAVIHGCAPLALAQAIVQAARPGCPSAVGLGARDVAMLRFRVGLLVAFAEQRPARCCHRSHSAFPAVLMLLGLALLLPHETSTAALDALHQSAEHALLFAWP